MRSASQSSNMLDFYAMQAAGGALPQLDPLRCLVTLSLALLPITMTKHYAPERDDTRKRQRRKHGLERDIERTEDASE